ncbi:MarR family transcriptional regulator [Nocardia sp. CDC159]|uniref:MarR family transcriptional regulator n=1 Tax=Nocardia pulmonis TaxID=2951408 RepID=A0A9X2EG72_9NOCA|nr:MULTISPECIES: MarR family transcriptional regulator [Nocardia]MCM6778950.1 MarR family transcriptional regulator [Nocardia pulmonis]MCM6791839.1 MarR family transcriptional regulator [Nocardia sp. CDC159]
MDSTQRLRDAAERLALTMAQGGMQKTTARVMTALLYSEQETMTAADLCERLSISTGAVSTAVKQLTQSGLIERVPAPGSRREHYRFPKGAWAHLLSQQNVMLKVMRDAAQEGLDAVAADTPTATRLHEMQDFYAYMDRELPPLIDRWRAGYGNGSSGA